MRIITKGTRPTVRRGRAAFMLVAAAGLGATALTASSTAASAPPKASSNHRVEATATDGSATPPAAFIAVTPIRILDTRPAPSGPVGLATAAKLGPGARLDLRLAGDGLIVPAAATGVLINVTIDEDATLPSYLTVWPMGEAQPFTSANNAYPGLIQANSLVAKLGNGGISVFNQRGSINLVIDLVGYIVPLSALDLPGAQLESGSGAPTAAVGDDGDFYIDVLNHILYGPKTGGAWPSPGITLGGGAAGPSGPAGAAGPAGVAGPPGIQGVAGTAGAAGTPGAAGSKILTGVIPPTGGQGVVGDIYVDTAAGSLYLKTGVATWTMQGSAGSLVGPQGIQGIQGIAGGAIAALGTFNDAPGALASAGPVTFVTANDVIVGSAISHTLNSADFVLATGTYRVSYRVVLGASILGGSARLSLNGTAVGSTGSILPAVLSVGSEASDTVLVVVTVPGSTLQLRNSSLVNVTLGSASIEIEKIA